jgi:hypothetical protein
VRNRILAALRAYSPQKRGHRSFTCDPPKAMPVSQAANASRERPKQAASQALGAVPSKSVAITSSQYWPSVLVAVGIHAYDNNHWVPSMRASDKTQLCLALCRVERQPFGSQTGKSD